MGIGRWTRLQEYGLTFVIKKAQRLSSLSRSWIGGRRTFGMDLRTLDADTGSTIRMNARRWPQSDFFLIPIISPIANTIKPRWVNRLDSTLTMGTLGKAQEKTGNPGFTPITMVMA